MGKIDRYPRKIMVGFQEGTCNLNCKKCFAFGPNSIKKKAQGKMEEDKIYTLIDEISKFDILPKLQPSIFTEPFANKDLKNIIRYCNDKNIGMSIITNGILIDEEWENFILTEMGQNFNLFFSIDAVTQQTYSEVRGDYDLSKLENKILRLLTLRKNNLPRIGVCFVTEKDNFKEKDEFIKKWAKKVDAVRIGSLLDNDKKIFEKSITNGIIKREICKQLFEVLVIDYNGDVRICAFDAFGDTFLGNVFEESIEAVWNGKLMNEIRQKHINNKFLESDFCKDCEGWRLYNLNIYDTEEFVISQGSNTIYYNKKL